MHNNFPPFYKLKVRIAKMLGRRAITLGRKKQAPTQERPLISVIVASYNYENLIGETLDSILSQTYTNFEIVVVDDGSKDNSVQVIQGYCDKDPRVHLYTHPGNINRGLPQTLKMAVEKSKGQYIAFCESDDIWLPDNLKMKVELINQYHDVGIITNDIEVFGEIDEAFKSRFDEYLGVIHQYVYPGGCHIDILKRSDVNFVPTFSCVCVRKDILDSVDWGTPINAWIDFWLWRQILSCNLLFYIDTPLTRWRIHKDSFNGTNSAKHNLLSPYLVYLSNLLLNKKQTFKRMYLTPSVITKLKQQGFFDTSYYLRTYDFVHYTDDDALYHYVLSGWRLGYNPSAQFDTQRYMAEHETQMPANTCPLLHYYYTAIDSGAQYPPKSHALVEAIKEANHRRLERRRAKRKDTTV